MARTLYRIYLYAVWLFLTIFVTIAVGVVLSTLLMASPLNGPSQITISNTVATQQILFALLAILIAGSLGGLHYWLIRRDIRDDPAAATGPVRALFLNGVEAIAVISGVPPIAFALASLANPYPGGIAGSLASGLVALGLFALLETERRQFSAAPGAAIVLQRLHFYGVQLILLFITTGFWLNALSNTVNVIFVNAGLVSSGCGPNGVCIEAVGFGQPLPNLFWLWAAAAFVTLVLVAYGLFVRHDGRSALRLLMHFAAYGYGLIFVLIGAYQAATLFLVLIQGQTISGNSFVGTNEFIPPAVFGVLAVAFYAGWLARDALRDPGSAHTLGLTALGITIAISAIPFWIGCAIIANNLLTALSPTTAPVSSDQWTGAIATLIAGAGYIPFSLRMRVLARRYPPATPRRGLVFALLGAGTLIAAIGLLVTLYAVVTSLAGAALDNWQVIARSGGVAFFIGAIISGIYFGRAQVEGWFRRNAPTLPATPAAASTPVPASPADVTLPGATSTIEGVLDALLAGTLTRDEAAARIRALPTPAS